MAAPPGDDARGRLVGDLVKYLFPAYQGVSAGQDRGVPVARQGPERHQPPRQGAGLRRPDPVPRRADPLARLARRRPRLRPPRGRSWPSWSSRQTPDRPVPIVSFVARQRDLRDLVGKNVPGAEQLNFADALRHWEGRFHTITLEDRNLPVIAEKRVLRPKDEACRPGAEARLRAGDQGPPRGHADPADPRRRPRDVPHGLPVQPGAGADAGGRLQRAPARADGAEDHAPAAGRAARHAAGSAT